MKQAKILEAYQGLQGMESTFPNSFMEMAGLASRFWKRFASTIINPKPTNELGDYAEFLQCFQKADYDFIGFKELGREAGKLILRHDIDFDTSLAYECAVIERQLEIKATYFFSFGQSSTIFMPRKILRMCAKSMNWAIGSACISIRLFTKIFKPD